MNIRHSLRHTAAALALLGGLGAYAAEATQWDPQADTRASTDATLNPTAWSMHLGEATQFHDATARDSIMSRSDVRSDLKLARHKGLLNDTGEGGATDRVLARRDAFNDAEQGRLLALNMPAPADEDLIAQLAATDFGRSATDERRPDEPIVADVASYRDPMTGEPMPQPPLSSG